MSLHVPVQSAESSMSYLIVKLSLDISQGVALHGLDTVKAQVKPVTAHAAQDVSAFNAPDVCNLTAEVKMKKFH